MATLKVRYTRSRSGEENLALKPLGFALTVEVIDSYEIPPEIFVFRRGQPGIDGTTITEFMNVASPVDIQDYPPNAPDLAKGMPWFRLPKVTLWFRSVDLLEEAQQLIESDIADLQYSWNILTAKDNFESQTDVVYGPDPFPDKPAGDSKGDAS